MLTQRIVRLNDKVRNTDPTIDLDRARLFTEFYSRPSMDNYILRRAKARGKELPPQLKRALEIQAEAGQKE